jgi:hypothetical protein
MHRRLEVIPHDLVTEWAATSLTNTQVFELG